MVGVHFYYVRLDQLLVVLQREKGMKGGREVENRYKNDQVGSDVRAIFGF
jgi:hypothetical protein